MNHKYYKATYPKEYVQTILAMPKSKQRERLEFAKRNVEHLRNGIHKNHFDNNGALAIARMLKEGFLIRLIENNLKTQGALK